MSNWNHRKFSFSYVCRWHFDGWDRGGSTGCFRVFVVWLRVVVLGWETGTLEIEDQILW